MLARLRSLSRSETGRAAELGIASMVGNVVALVFTLVFTRVLGQVDYGSLAALMSTFLILTVPGYAMQTTVAREVSGAIAAGDPDPGAAIGRWMRRLLVGMVVLALVCALGREVLAAVIGVGDFPWAAAAAPLAGALWLMLSIERGALVGFQRYRLVGVSIVVEQVARLGFGLLFVGVGLDVTGAFLGTPFAVAAIGLMLWRPLRAHVGSGGIAPGVPGHRLRDLALRGWVPIAALGLVAWLQDGHIIIVKHLASGEDAGAWAALSVAGKAIMFVAIGLAGYVVPEVARRAGAGEDPRGVLLRVLGLIGALAVPMVLVYAVAGDEVLDIAFQVSGGGGALPLVGLAMALLAFSYLATQYQLALHRVRFVLVLLVAAVAMPLLLLAIGSSLTALAAGLAGLNLVLTMALLALALPRAVAAGGGVPLGAGAAVSARAE
jgi:O-antigen/teichoic acid export membrane protein